MSNNRKYKPAKGKKAHVLWFGFRLTDTSAQLLFIGSVLIIICCLVSLLWLGMSFVTLLSAYSAIESASGTSGFTENYGSTILLYYLVYLFVIILFLAIAVYTINRTKKLRYT